ncbi:hypothetical protein JXA70_04960 [candidate division KSB1 bacterium]|nr:hypothetical protein [candidate division KSB1 bacterium]
MMARMLHLFCYDVVFQFRHGFYTIYLIISVIYITILLSIPDSVRLIVTNALVFSDTSVLGLTFVGALLLLEKQQGILYSLFVTPVRLSEYLFAKVSSLSLLAMLASGSIFVIANGFHALSILFLFGVVWGSSIFTLIGLGIGARVSSLNGYLFGIMAGTFIFAAPLLGYLKVYDGLWLYLLPTRATLVLLASTLQSPSMLHILYAVLCLMLWTHLAWLFAIKSFSTFILGVQR